MRVILWIVAALVLTSCDRRQAPTAAEPTPVEEAPAPPDQRPAIVAFGDSLSSGHGVEPGASYPDFLQQLLDQRGYRYRVVNAGTGGDTTSGGLSRVDSIIAMKPAMVILELGGNDGLRGLPLEKTRANLEQIVTALQKTGAIVVLAGMTLPPNYGPDYITRFEQLYRSLAAKHRLPLIPFLLQDVAGRKDLMQDDGIHPTAAGNSIAAQNVFKIVAPLLAR